MHGAHVACRALDLAVARGSVFCLFGQAGAGKTSVVEALLGQRKPTEGRALVFGEDAWKKRRRLRGRIGTDPASAAELVVLDEVPVAPERPDPNQTVFLATSVPAHVAAAAMHVGVLRNGRLVLNAPTRDLAPRFRRIRYVNELTETRTAFGTELDAFDAVRVQVRGWGIDAVVSNFDPEAFERFRAIDGVTNAEALTLTLTEILLAVAGDAPPQSGRPTQ